LATERRRLTTPRSTGIDLCFLLNWRLYHHFLLYFCLIHIVLKKNSEKFLSAKSSIQYYLSWYAVMVEHYLLVVLLIMTTQENPLALSCPHAQNCKRESFYRLPQRLFLFLSFYFFFAIIFASKKERKDCLKSYNINGCTNIIIFLSKNMWLIIVIKICGGLRLNLLFFIILFIIGVKIFFLVWGLANC